MMNAEEIRAKIAEIVSEQDIIDKKIGALAPGHDDEFTRLMNVRRELTKKLVPLQDNLIDTYPKIERIDTRTDDEIMQDMTNS
ncbi:MAG: hypothetical protein ABFC78_09365 [Methanoregula sp.]